MLSTFKGLYEEQIDALNKILDESQNEPPEGTADGSIVLRRWNKLQALVDAARAYNDALARAIDP